MREVKVIIIISIIACLAAPVLLYLGFNYYRDKKFSYIHKPMDRLWKLKQITDRGIGERNKVILDSACAQGLSEKILDAIYGQKQLVKPKIVESHQTIGHISYLLEDKMKDTVYTLSIILYPDSSKKIDEWEISSFETEMWRKEAVIARFDDSGPKHYREGSREPKEAIKAAKQFQKGIIEKNVSVLDSVCVKGMSEKILKEIYEKKGMVEFESAVIRTVYYVDEGRGYQYKADFLLKDTRNDTATFRVDLYLKEVSSGFKVEMFELWRRIDKS